MTKPKTYTGKDTLKDHLGEDISERKEKEKLPSEIAAIIDKSRGEIYNQVESYRQKISPLTEGSMSVSLSANASMGAEYGIIYDEAGGSMGAQIERAYSAKREALLEKLKKIGQTSPIASISMDDISYYNLSSEQLIAECRDKNLEAIIIKSKNRFGGSEDTLYAYDKVALQELLDDNYDLLIKEKWPLNATGFVDYVHYMRPMHKSALTDLIDKALGR